MSEIELKLLRTKLFPGRKIISISPDNNVPIGTMGSVISVDATGIVHVEWEKYGVGMIFNNTFRLL